MERKKEEMEDHAVKYNKTTREVAETFHVQPESVRRSLCLNGHYMGYTPVKLPNGRLLWPDKKMRA